MHWKGVHDARALARKESELLDQSAPGRGFSTEVEKLERRLIQQEKPLLGFILKSKSSKISATKLLRTTHMLMMC